MARARDTLLKDLLRDTSRSFYLTLRVLPGSIRDQIGLAYLLARTTDTIADTQLMPLDRRLESLSLLRKRIAGEDSTKLDFADIARQQGLAAERSLLERVEESLSVLAEFPAQDQHSIREVLETITSGQVLDLERFSDVTETEIRVLQNEQQLDDYTYRVAGCVGRFWTKMCLAHAFPAEAVTPDSASDSFEELGIRFGKGLQLVNILRDIPADLKQGRCYIPADRLNRAGLDPSDLKNPVTEPRFRGLYNELLARAEGHLLSGWSYTNRIPWTQIRIRLACAWPVLIGLQTVRLLRSENVLDPSRRIKVNRAAVRSIILRSIALYPFPSAWQKFPGRQLNKF